jgi:hypothetical protein
MPSNTLLGHKSLESQPQKMKPVFMYPPVENHPEEFSTHRSTDASMGRGGLVTASTIDSQFSNLSISSRLALSTDHLVLVQAPDFCASITLSNLDSSRSIAFELIWPPKRFRVIPDSGVLPPAHSQELVLSYMSSEISHSLCIHAAGSHEPLLHSLSSSSSSSSISVTYPTSQIQTPRHEPTQLGILVHGKLWKTIRIEFIPMAPPETEGKPSIKSCFSEPKPMS